MTAKLMGGKFNGRLIPIENVNKPIKMGKIPNRIKYTFDSWIDERRGIALYKTK
jgi:hypothetical protein